MLRTPSAALLFVIAAWVSLLAGCGGPGERAVRRFLSDEYPGLEVKSMSLDKRPFGRPGDKYPSYRLNGTAVVRLSQPAYDDLEWTEVVKKCGGWGLPERPESLPFVLREKAPAGAELRLTFETDASREGDADYEIHFRRAWLTDPKTEKQYPYSPISRHHVKYGYVVVDTPEFKAFCDRHIPATHR